METRQSRCPITGIMHEEEVSGGRPRVYLHSDARVLSARLNEVERLVPAVAAGGMTEAGRNDLRQRLRDLCGVVSNDAVITQTPEAKSAELEAHGRAAAEAQRSMAAIRRTEAALRAAGSPEAERWEAARAALSAPYSRVLKAADSRS